MKLLLRICLLVLPASAGFAWAQVGDIPNAPDLTNRVDPVSMGLKFDAGKTYRFISNNFIRMQLPGQGIREATVEQQARFDVTAREDGRAGVDLRGRIERLKVDFRSGDKRIMYDSFKPEDRSSQLGQHFRNSLNRWVNLRLSEEWQIVDVSYGGREGLGTVLAGVPQFGLNELEKLIAEIPQGLPEARVRPGDFWQLNGVKEVSDLGDLEFDFSYRFLGMDEYEGASCFDIQVNGQLGGVAKIPEEGGEMAGEDMSFPGSSLSGRILFDPANGMVRLREQAVSMLLELPSGEEGQFYQVPVEQNARIRLLHVIATQ
ncbi:MAG: hypothetical protein AAGF67_16785 [Verrucomicrobiota bacterium]